MTTGFSIQGLSDLCTSALVKSVDDETRIKRSRCSDRRGGDTANSEMKGNGQLK